MKIYLSLIICFSLSCFGISQSGLAHQQKQDKKILIVLSNAGYYGSSEIMTSNHFSETVVPYDEFVKAGYKVDLVSPQGGRVPIGYINTSDSVMAQYIHDHNFMDQIEHTKKPAQINTSEYIAIFYSGGGAAMFGVPENEALQKIAMAIYEQSGGVVSAICHGTAGLVNLKTNDGKYLVKGKSVNGFPDLFENMEGEYYKQFPFSIEETIRDRGGSFVFSKQGWDEHYIIDGRLVTGQDPSSAKVLARKIIEVLASMK